jgi:mono/diheme cytochrome c family protein
MRKLFGILLALVGVVVLLLGALAAYVQLSGIPHYPRQPVDLKVEVTPERVARGRKLAAVSCIHCHLDPKTGAFTGRELPEMGGEMGPIFSKNITGDREKGVGAWSDGDLAYLFRTGIRRDGQFAPPWMPRFANTSDSDVADVIAFLRSDDPWVRSAAVEDHESQPNFLAKALFRFAMKPLPYPTKPIAAPDPADKVAYGRYLVQGRYLCYECHAPDFSVVNPLEPEKTPGYLGGGNPMLDMDLRKVHTANITPHPEAGIGKWTEEQFGRALTQGLRPDGSLIRAPMARYADLEPAEVAGLFAYLRTVPPLDVPRKPNDPPAMPASKGAEAFHRYGCNSCHGESGVGIYDLRQGARKWPGDQLIAYIRNPQSFVPGVKMPSWDGVIREEDYEPLAEHVRKLCENAPAPTPTP